MVGRRRSCPYDQPRPPGPIAVLSNPEHVSQDAPECVKYPSNWTAGTATARIWPNLLHQPNIISGAPGSPLKSPQPRGLVRGDALCPLARLKADTHRVWQHQRLGSRTVAHYNRGRLHILLGLRKTPRFVGETDTEMIGMTSADGRGLIEWPNTWRSDFWVCDIPSWSSPVKTARCSPANPARARTT